MACLMGLTAVGIEMVLPIFPDISAYYQLSPEDHSSIQQVILVYMLGFSLFQVVLGILADTLGRKPLLLLGIAIYLIGATLALFVESFSGLLWMRFLQEAGLAAPRVLSMTIISDVSSGRQMSKVMSLVQMVFLSVPAIAPIIGQGVIAVAPWQSVFILLVVFGVILFICSALDLTETLRPEDRIPLSVKPVLTAGKAFWGNRDTQVYLIIISLYFDTLVTHLGQSGQILQEDVFGLGELFPLAFAAIVLGMIVSALVNARLVMRMGMKKLLQLGFWGCLIGDGAMLAFVINDGTMPLWAFITLLIVRFFAFGLVMPNINALAITPYRHIAGTASALIGTITSVIAVLIAQLVSACYDGTLYALSISFFISSFISIVAYYAFCNTKS